MKMEGTTAMHVWVCPCCVSGLDRYGHEATWTEHDDNRDGFYNEDGRVGDNEFGLCVVCLSMEAEIYTGLFLENHAVDYEILDTSIVYKTVIPT